jgi:hypothetical protein
LKETISMRGIAYSEEESKLVHGVFQIDVKLHSRQVEKIDSYRLIQSDLVEISRSDQSLTVAMIISEMQDHAIERKALVLESPQVLKGFVHSGQQRS